VPAPVFNLRQNFGRVLRWWRLEAGLPAKRVAHDTGYSVSSISAWETGTRMPKADTLTDIILYTGLVPCRFFCGRTGPCSPANCPFVSR
jgi:transcriptional regulator with XRE-family HTH domain